LFFRQKYWQDSIELSVLRVLRGNFKLLKTNSFWKKTTKNFCWICKKNDQHIDLGMNCSWKIIGTMLPESFYAPQSDKENWIGIQYLWDSTDSAERSCHKLSWNCGISDIIYRPS
jgi:hypothetical protein